MHGGLLIYTSKYPSLVSSDRINIKRLYDFLCEKYNLYIWYEVSAFSLFFLTTEGTLLLCMFHLLTCNVGLAYGTVTAVYESMVHFCSIILI